ncbi:Uncharacterized protein PECH_006125 [Penicillium ucsense]|uniref:ATP-dependent DNA ligase family profile domain-containing protein n=1 Tax=Penicillium ucsense TaxID=2839758 RepID=A0A8J8WGS9_9EURO|nr:Uncharacterized protein PECM_006598 [Penicillium ucsense]KAF7735772.1 Uncharacterized protein PECH_006125 [Penicillium ucsense]
MGFKFSFLCDLLSQLEQNEVVKATTVKRDVTDYQTVARWFNCHAARIHHPETDALAFLSCLLPEKRSDRVYGLQAASLARVIGRCLGLGSSRLAELDRWRSSGGPDLGQCVENVLRQAENSVHRNGAVTTEEIDQALDKIASRSRFSAPQARRQQAAVDVESALSPLYRRLSSRDAKWLTRMILKSYLPVTVTGKFALQKFHFLLPHLLQFQASLEGALETLSLEPMNKYPPNPDRSIVPRLSSAALDHFKPRIGIKIGRPEYYKARSTKHCHDMARGRRMSMERKYDGEYCQFHVDLTNKQNPFKIFAKSGKDSTADRAAIIPTLTRCLDIGAPGCKFKHSCILEGELVVWSDELDGIADFHKLRRHLPRSGTYIGTESDSPPQPYEHLMVIFFDILLIDDNVCLRAPHFQRRLLLQDLVQLIPGRAALAEQDMIDFSESSSRFWLEDRFAKAISQRWEGLVLKASDEPYFSIHAAGMNDQFGRWIKLKKDYIPGLGDTVDLALVGASYNAQDAAALSSIGGLRWTHFLVGCLLNKDAVVQHGTRPHFRGIDVVDRHSMHWKILQLLNQLGQFHSRDPDSFNEVTIEMGRVSLPKVSVVFKKPFVVEVMGGGFEKPSGARYFSLRFPRILKIHDDRSLEDAASFQELQLLAENARAVPVDELSQEQNRWRAQLKVGGNGQNQYLAHESDSPTTTTSSTSTTTASYNSETTMSAHKAGIEILQVNDCAEETRLIMADQSQDENVNPTSELVGHEKSQSSHNTGQATTHKRPLSEDHPSPNIPPAKKQLLGGSRAVVSPDLETQDDDQGLHHNGVSQDHAQGPQDNEAPHTVAGTETNDHNSDNPGDARNINTQSGNSSQPGIDKFAKKLSPLMTIPVYLSGQPCDGVVPIGEQDSPSFSQFCQALLSERTLAVLSKSNPRAAFEETVYGIVLVNVKVLPLVENVLKIRGGLKRAIANNPSSQVKKGRIFFVDHSLLNSGIEPDDKRFCLGETWRKLAPKCHYACLHWKVNDQVEGLEAPAQSDNTAGPWKRRSKILGREHPIMFYLRGDPADLAELGEFSKDRHKSPFKDTKR